MSVSLQSALNRGQALALSKRRSDQVRVLGAARDGERDALLSALSREIGLAAASVTGLTMALDDDRVCEPLGARQDRAVGALRQAGHRLMALAEDLTDASHVLADEPPSRVDPVLALHAACERLKPRLENQSVRLIGPGAITGLGARVPPALLDALLDQMLDAAAGLAGPDGALMLEVRKVRQIEIRTELIGPAFTQDDLQDRLTHGGELGLTRRRARRMGGDLTARPVTEIGARLILSLPSADARSGDSLILPPFDPIGGSVLLIGFCSADRALVRLTADAVGLSALYTAENETAGLRMVNELEPDVVIIDLAAPRMDAASIAHELDETSHRRPARRLVLAGGTPSSVERRRLRRCGYDHVLARPLDIADLAHVLKSAMAS